MPVNVGDCFVPAKVYQERSVILKFTQENTDLVKYIRIPQKGSVVEWASCTSYQWGYKDPILPWSGEEDSPTNKTWYDTNGVAHTDIFEENSNSSLAFRIQNPNTYRASYSNAYFHSPFLWNNAIVYDASQSTSRSYEDGKVCKTIYDPSPRGFTIMPHFIATIIKSYSERSIHKYMTAYDIEGNDLVFSASARRDCADMAEIELRSQLWTSLYRMQFHADLTSQGAADSHAFQIRSVKEF